MKTIVNDISRERIINSLCPPTEAVDECTELEESMKELCRQIREDLAPLNKVEW